MRLNTLLARIIFAVAALAAIAAAGTFAGIAPLQARPAAVLVADEGPGPGDPPPIIIWLFVPLIAQS